MESKKAREFIDNNITIVDNGYGGEIEIVDLCDAYKAVEIAEEELSAHLPIWHDLRKNPEDLPKLEEKVIALDSEGAYHIDSLEEYDGSEYWLYCTYFEIIAWCKLPKSE